MNRVTVQQIHEEFGESLDLKLLSEISDEDIVVGAQDVHRPGMALMGFTENFLPGRLQVMGASEMAYLNTLSRSEQTTAFERVIGLETPACYVTRSMPVPDALLHLARERKFPLYSTSLPVVEFISELTHFLEREFALNCEKHGTLVDVYGVGLLFTGRSGIGKSECALDLVERGHRLVADDIVEIIRSGDDMIIGYYRDVLQHNIEIRGIGVIDLQAIFGIRAIRMQKRIEVEVRLQDWDDERDYERLGLERKYCEILGVRIPQVIVPLFPGKNITVISEVIALDFMLKVYGYDAAHVLNQRILESMTSGNQLRRYLKQDRE